MDGSIG